MTASAGTRGRLWGGEQPEWLLLATIVAALLLGWAMMAGLTLRTNYVDPDGLSLRYPSSWTGRVVQGPPLVAVGDLETGTTLTVRVMRTLDPAQPVTMDDLVTQLAFERGRELPMYRVLQTVPTRLGGVSATAVGYAYVAEPARSVYQSTLPVVMRGTDYLVAHSGRVYLISLETRADNSESEGGDFARVLASIRFR